MSQLLKRYIQMLVEDAVAGKSAVSSGLALMRKPTTDGLTLYVVYVPSVIEGALSSGDITDETISKGIVAYLCVKPHQGDAWNAGEVKLAAAQKGYGPLMYGFAMNDFAGGLFPDREKVSASARNVWKKYSQRGDVTKQKFDDAKNPQTPDKIDDAPLVPGTDLKGGESYLNTAYDAPGDAGNRSELMQHHKKFIAHMAKKKMSASIVETMIEEIGDNYFKSRYAG
jgi:hypothetical protein